MRGRDDFLCARHPAGSLTQENNRWNHGYLGILGWLNVPTWAQVPAHWLTNGTRNPLWNYWWKRKPVDKLASCGANLEPSATMLSSHLGSFPEVISCFATRRTMLLMFDFNSCSPQGSHRWQRKVAMSTANSGHTSLWFNQHIQQIPIIEILTIYGSVRHEN